MSLLVPGTRLPDPELRRRALIGADVVCACVDEDIAERTRRSLSGCAARAAAVRLDDPDRSVRAAARRLLRRSDGISRQAFLDALQRLRGATAEAADRLIRLSGVNLPEHITHAALETK